MSRAWAFSGGQGVMQLRRRYTNLYIPGDFFDVRPAWIASIPLDQPIRMHSPVAFHILDKIIDRPSRVDNAILDAPDADSRWQAKVVLLAAPGLDAIRLKAYGLGSDGSLDETVDPHSLTRVISFLVGQCECHKQGFSKASLSPFFVAHFRRRACLSISFQQ